MTKPIQRTTADIKKFTGFIAPDGTTHTSLTAATAYTKDLKVKEALAAFATMDELSEGFSQTDSGATVVAIEDLPTFLLAHRDAILAAYGQSVTLRAPRNSKPKKAAAPKAAPAAIAPPPSIAAQMAADGLVDVEE